MLDQLNDKTRSYLYLHLCVFLWGFTAILGALISLEALPLVWWRVVIAGAGLFLLGRMTLKHEVRGLSPSHWRQLILIGVLIGVHWLCFYGAIKKANASIAVVAMATTSLFSAFAEPFLLKEKLKWHETLLGILILPGIYLIVEDIDWSMRKGFVMGIVAALLAAVFSVLNKKLLTEDSPPSPKAMSFVQLWTIVFFLPLLLSINGLREVEGEVAQTLLAPLFFALPESLQFSPTPSDWLWLFILAIACTLLPFVLTLVAMRHLSAFATNLTINLEPVYGVILAGLILKEHKDLNLQFYVGVAVILGVIFLYPLFSKHNASDKTVDEK